MHITKHVGLLYLAKTNATYIVVESTQTTRTSAVKLKIFSVLVDSEVICKQHF